MDDHTKSLLWGTLLASLSQLAVALAALVWQWVTERRKAAELQLIEIQSKQAKVAAQSAHSVSLENAVAIEEVRAHVTNHTHPDK